MNWASLVCFNPFPSMQFSADLPEKTFCRDTASITTD